MPTTELKGGLAEVVKYGVIKDYEFFASLEQHKEEIFALNYSVIMQMIARCCEIKARVVEQDEKEVGLRRILNFGHTIGHAVEAASRFQIIHGLAVAMGMRAAADLAVLGGHLRKEEAQRIRRLLESYDMPVVIPPELDREEIKEYLQIDKKTIGGHVFFVLPEAIGKVIITDQVREADIDSVLASG